jgi:hypothetical protein
MGSDLGQLEDMCVISHYPYINSKECNNLYVTNFTISDLHQKADDAKICLSPSYILFTTGPYRVLLTKSL